MAERKYTVTDAGRRIESFLGTLVRNANFKVKWEIIEGDAARSELETPDLLVRFSGPDTEILLANKGELLLALEQLTQEALRMPPQEHSLICFDANDYRLMRMEELRLSALTAAEKVKQTKVPFKFNPMNSRERRIIHLALRNEPAVRSESSGVGPTRQVVIYPAGMPAPAASAAVGGSSPPFRRRRR